MFFEVLKKLFKRGTNHLASSQSLVSDSLVDKGWKIGAQKEYF